MVKLPTHWRQQKGRGAQKNQRRAEVIGAATD
jgi:hypothetical protein